MNCDPSGEISNGPKVILYDFVRLKTWDILTYGGLVTYVCHDVNGQLTWITCSSGIIVHLKSSEGQKQKLLGNPFHFYNELLPDFSEVPDGFKICPVLSSLVVFCEYYLCLHIHTSCIMPPGTWHTVYTPVSCMTSGGHLLMYDTLDIWVYSQVFADGHTQSLMDFPKI